MTTKSFRKKLNLYKLGPKSIADIETVTNATEETMEADVNFVNGVILMLNEHILGIGQAKENAIILLSSRNGSKAQEFLSKSLNTLLIATRQEGIDHFLFHSLTMVHPNINDYYDLNPDFKYLQTDAQKFPKDNTETTNTTLSEIVEDNEFPSQLSDI